MEFKNLISKSKNTQQIISDLTQNPRDSYDLAILFFAQSAAEEIKTITEKLKNHYTIRNLIGCTSAGIISTQEEIENQPAVSLILAKLPGVNILPFTLNQVGLEGLKSKTDFYKFFEIFPTENPVFLVLPDPFSINMNYFLDSVNSFFPQCPIIGGLASAATQPNGNTLVLNGECIDAGMVGVVLTGNIKIETIVSQGCRPIGETFIVTKSQDNIIFELAGRPFLNVLKEVFDKSTAREKLLVQESIFVGIAMNEYKDEFKRGDFLIRGLMGIDEKMGAGAIGDYIKAGQTIQFHVRDAETATEDLNIMLETNRKDNLKPKPTGALVFSCNGRGQYLFKQKNHDIDIIQKHIGPIPAAGFFCAGEIGPVGGSNFLHGFTDSIALFYPKTNS